MFKLCVVLLCCLVLSDALDIISRSEWGANPPKIQRRLAVNPPTYVTIHHAASASCTTKSACMSLVKSFQRLHMTSRNWPDIGYNFLVGEDGNIYEGRGWGIHGSHSVPLNRKSIGICMIGNFMEKEPNAAAQNTVKELINYGVANGKISTSYKLVGHRQADKTQCPGNKLYDLIKTWDHYSSTL